MALHDLLQPNLIVGVERFELNDLKLPADLPLSLPSKMIEQRPDVRAAEANLHSTAALVGVAVAAQLPQINLSTVLGSQSTSLPLFFSPLTGPASTVASAVSQGPAGPAATDWRCRRRIPARASPTPGRV